MTKKISGLFVGAVLGILTVFCIVIIFSVLGFGNLSSIDSSYIGLMLIVFVTIGAILGYLIRGTVSFGFVNFKAKTIAIVIIAMILTSIIPFRIDIPTAWMTLMKSESPEGTVCFYMVRSSVIGWPFSFLFFGGPDSCTSVLIFNPITFVFDFLIFLMPVSLISYIFRKRQQF